MASKKPKSKATAPAVITAPAPRVFSATPDTFTELTAPPAVAETVENLHIKGKGRALAETLRTENAASCSEK